MNVIITVQTGRGDLGFMHAAKSDLLYLCSVCVTVTSTEMRGKLVPNGYNSLVCERDVEVTDTIYLV